MLAVRLHVAACLVLVGACSADRVELYPIECDGPAPICGQRRSSRPCGCGSPGQLSLMHGQTYSCRADGCLEPVPYPRGCFPDAPDLCTTFGGTWSLTYTNWHSRTGDDLDDAGIASSDAGVVADDFAACKQGRVDGWSSLKITSGPDGICVDLGQGSFPDGAVQAGGCDPPPGGTLEITKSVTLTKFSGTYRADSKLELSMTWPRIASGTWTTVVSGSGECRLTASVSATLER